MYIPLNFTTNYGKFQDYSSIFDKNKKNNYYYQNFERYFMIQLLNVGDVPLIHHY